MDIGISRGILDLRKEKNVANDSKRYEYVPRHITFNIKKYICRRL